MKKNLLTISTILFITLYSLHSSASSLNVSGGELFGYVKDSADSQPIAFAVVVIKSGENVIGGANTDANGRYKISTINPGTYTVEASFINYKTARYKGVIISADQTLRMDMLLSVNQSEDIEVIGYIDPIINKTFVSDVYNISPEDIKHSAELSAQDRAAQGAGVFQRDAGQSLNIRGSRDDATVYIIDGIKMSGKFSIPSGAVEQMSVFLGGIPAEFGDATGGFVVITTKSFFSH